jgi:hypothetical protein
LYFQIPMGKRPGRNGSPSREDKGTRKMSEESTRACKLFPYRKERNKVGVWGFGNVSRDVVLSLLSEGLGKEIVFYGRPKGDYPNRAGAWIEDLKANISRGPRLMGTNSLADPGTL